MNSPQLLSTASPSNACSLPSQHLPHQCFGCCFCRSRLVPSFPRLPSRPGSGHCGLCGRRKESTLGPPVISQQLLVFPRPPCPQHNKWLSQHIRADKPAAERHRVHASICGQVPLGASLKTELSRPMGIIRNYSVSAEQAYFQWAWGPLSLHFQAAPCCLSCPLQGTGWYTGAIYQVPIVYQALSMY